MGCVAAKPGIIVQQACRNEIDFAVLVRMRRWTAAGAAESRKPPSGSRDLEAADLMLPGDPLQVRSCCVEDCISVCAGHLPALRAVTLPDRANLSKDNEADFAAKT